MLRLLSALAALVLVSACASDRVAIRIDHSPQQTLSMRPPTGASIGAESGTLDCDQVIDETDAAADSMSVVGDGVAVPASTTMRSALPATPATTPETGSAYFAKWGLQVRRDTHVELVVPSRAGTALWIGWGSPGQPSPRVVVDRCDGTRPWIVFAGGYWVRTVGCHELLVCVNDGPQQSVPIAIGAPCPGQSPSVPVGK